MISKSSQTSYRHRNDFEFSNARKIHEQMIAREILETYVIFNLHEKKKVMSSPCIHAVASWLLSRFHAQRVYPSHTVCN